MVLSMVTKDAFAIVESFAKNQCKGKPYNFIPFNPLPPLFFSNFFIISFTFM
jgi:hypothetical protein